MHRYLMQALACLVFCFRDAFLLMRRVALHNRVGLRAARFLSGRSPLVRCAPVARRPAPDARLEDRTSRRRSVVCVT